MAAGSRSTKAAPAKRRPSANKKRKPAYAAKPKRGDRLRRIVGGIGGYGPWWTRLLRWLAFLAVAGILAGALTFFVLYQAIAIPSKNADFLTQTTKVYYADGKNVIGEFANQDRENVDLEEIPASMQAAVIAAEDRTFYTNRGIDVRGIIRAVRDNASAGEITGGGSTITQQYVKILYLTQEQSYTRKVKEAVLSVKIHNQLSKKEILEGYLNTIYFGNRAYGVQVASQTYFDKPASELNYAQSALLATIINSPSYYDPYAEGAAERILPRFNYVLDGMQKSGAITAEEREKFRERVPKVKELEIDNRLGGTKGYVLDMVKKQMDQLDFTPAQVEGGGYKIVTTIQRSKQRAAVSTVKAVKPGGLDELHTALVSIEPGDGAVRALYGGPNFVEEPLNWATLPTQPGSTFKVFAVVAALENGYSLQTNLNGASPMQIGDGVVENQGDSGGASFGNVSLERATQESINTAFVDLTLQLGGGEESDAEAGAEMVLESANEAGIPTSVTDDIGRVAVTSLGFAGVPPIDMANAYATIASGGIRADWYLVDEVQDAQGETVYQHEKQTERTIEEDVAGDTIKAMQAVVNGGTGASGRTVCTTAGKTGTATAGADPNDQHVSSSWFAGFTPKLATAVMYNRGKGNEDLEGYLVPFFGGTYPARTFQTYMNQALDAADCGEFVPPGNIQATKGVKYRAPKPKPKPKPKPTRTTQAPEPTETPTEPPADDDGGDSDIFPG